MNQRSRASLSLKIDEQNFYISVQHGSKQGNTNNSCIHVCLLPIIHGLYQNVALKHDLRKTLKSKLADSPEPSESFHVLLGHIDHPSVYQIKLVLLLFGVAYASFHEYSIVTDQKEYLDKQVEK